MFLVILIILSAIANGCNCKISNERLCGDADCAQPVSYARTLLRYSGDDSRLVSFPPGATVSVYSKSAGSNLDLWGIEYKGKRGYAPKGFLREERVLVSKLDFVIPTEVEEKPVVNIASSVPQPEENVVKSSESYEVVSGTTIFYNDLESASPIANTALPLEAAVQESEVEEASASQETTPSPPEENEEQEPQEEEGSAQRLYHYISSLLPLEGSGFLSSSEETFTDPPSPEEDKIGEDDVPDNSLDVDVNNVTRGDSDSSIVEREGSDKNDAAEVQETIESASEVRDEIPTSDNEVSSSSPSANEDVEEVNIETSVKDSDEDIEVPDSTEDDHEDDTEKDEVMNNTNLYPPGSEYVIDPLNAEPPQNTDSVPLASETTESLMPGLNLNSGLDTTSDLSQKADDNVEPVDNIAPIFTTDSPYILDSQVPYDELVDRNPETITVPSFETTSDTSFHAVPTESSITNDPTSEEAIKPDDDVKSVDVEIVDTPNVPEHYGEQNVDTSIYNYLDPIGDSTPIDKLVIDQVIHEPLLENTADNDESTTSAQDLHEESSTVSPRDEEIKINQPSIDDTESSGSFFGSIFHRLTFFHSDSNESEDKTAGNENSSQDEFLTTEGPSDPATCDRKWEFWMPFKSWEIFQEDKQLPAQNSLLGDTNVNEISPVGNYFGVLTIAITAMAMLLFTLGYYQIENSRQDSLYVGKINKLEKSLYVTRKEFEQLKEETNSSFCNSEEIELLKDELNSKAMICNSLEEQVKTLNLELEVATETGEELYDYVKRISGDVEATNKLRESIETLEEQLSSQQTTITATNKMLFTKNMESDLQRVEIANLKESLEKAKSALEDSSKVCDIMRDEMSHQKEEWAKNHEADLTARQSDVVRLEGKVKDLEEKLQARESELSILKGSIEKISSGDSQEIFDVAEVAAKLDVATHKCSALQEQLTEEVGARKLLEDHVKVVTLEIIRLQEGNAQAEKEKAEAINKLHILTTYFEEKEAMLQKDIDMHESLFKQKEGDADSMLKHVKSLQEQANHYKSQIEMLKKECEDQAHGFKEQLHAAENRAHDNWLAARQAERRCEDMKHEAVLLRNRLTATETQLAKGAANNDHSVMANDRVLYEGMAEELRKTPLHMVYMDSGNYAPPPYMPPPLFEPDQRLPPLGCLPAAPPPPMPPPTYPARSRHHDAVAFRQMPPPLHSGRAHRAGSNSSGHSSESRDRSGPRKQT